MKTLRQLQNNQIVICEELENGEYIYEFFSYETLIARYTKGIERGKLELTSYYDYSSTTSKYLHKFIEEYCRIYYKDTKDLKKLIVNGGTAFIDISFIK